MASQADTENLQKVLSQQSQCCKMADKHQSTLVNNYAQGNEKKIPSFPCMLIRAELALTTQERSWGYGRKVTQNVISLCFGNENKGTLRLGNH